LFWVSLYNGSSDKNRKNLDEQVQYKLRGYIDRLDRKRDGRYEIHDYKTSRFFPEQSKMDQDRQLALYQLGVQNMWNEVSAFSEAELKKIIKEEKWASTILDELKKFVRIENIKTVRLLKNKHEE